MDIEKKDHVVPPHRISRRQVGAWLLGLMILTGVVFGPLGLPMYVFVVFAAVAAWAVLWLAGGIHLVRARRRVVDIWSSMVLVVPLVFVSFIMRMTPYPLTFEEGLIGRLEMRTDIEAVQTWVESLDPNDCRGDPHMDRIGRNLTAEQLLQVLPHQDGMVRLELDAEGRPCVRLTWLEGKAGTWGLVIGRRTMKTPPSEPGMYGERRTELRPGVYFWYVEAACEIKVSGTFSGSICACVACIVRVQWGHAETQADHVRRIRVPCAQPGQWPSAHLS